VKICYRYSRLSFSSFSPLPCVFSILNGTVLRWVPALPPGAAGASRPTQQRRTLPYASGLLCLVRRRTRDAPRTTFVLPGADAVLFFSFFAFPAKVLGRARRFVRRLRVHCLPCASVLPLRYRFGRFYATWLACGTRRVPACLLFFSALHLSLRIAARAAILSDRLVGAERFGG